MNERYRELIKLGHAAELKKRHTFDNLVVLMIHPELIEATAEDLLKVLELTGRTIYQLQDAVEAAQKRLKRSAATEVGSPPPIVQQVGKAP